MPLRISVRYHDEEELRTVLSTELIIWTERAKAIGRIALKESPELLGSLGKLGSGSSYLYTATQFSMPVGCTGFLSPLNPLKGVNIARVSAGSTLSLNYARSGRYVRYWRGVQRTYGIPIVDPTGGKPARVRKFAR